MVRISQKMIVPLLLPVCAARIASAIVKLLQISTAVFVAPKLHFEQVAADLKDRKCSAR